ncbi:MAG: DUF5606 domain-containing protein [Flavobacteriia bacterium]|jgi:hypothetical protein
MNLTGIISISGKPGLYKVVAQGKNNIIVESLEDKKRTPAYSSDRISALEDISIYTYDEDVSLKEILKSIFDKEKGAPCISHKEDKTKLENYLLEVLPNYDQERVYTSDVKKIFQWYNLLHKAGELKVEEEVKEVVAKEPKAKAKKEDSSEATEKPVKKEAKTVKKPAATKKVDSKAAPKSTAKSAAPKKVTAVKTGGGRGK